MLTPESSLGELWNVCAAVVRLLLDHVTQIGVQGKNLGVFHSGGMLQCLLYLDHRHRRQGRNILSVY
jgi:hypothetical protein